MRDKLTTKELAQILGVSYSSVYHLVKTRASFPKPEKARNGTQLLFPLREVVDWLVENKRESKIDLSKLLESDEAPAKEMLTTTEVLLLMQRKPTHGNRSALGKLVKAEVLPPPSIKSGGRSESLWEADIIRPAVLAWRKAVAVKQGGTTRHWSDLPGLPASPKDPED